MIFGKNRACFAFANVKTPCDQLLKMGRSCKIISEEGFFFRILVPMKRKGDARAPSSSSSARPNTPHTHKTHTHIDCEEIYCDRIFPHHHYNKHHAK